MSIVWKMEKKGGKRRKKEGFCYKHYPLLLKRQKIGREKWGERK